MQYCCIILSWKSYQVCLKLQFPSKSGNSDEYCTWKLTHIHLCKHLEPRQHTLNMLSKRDPGPEIIIKDYYLISQHALSSRTTGPNFIPAATFVKLDTASFLWINKILLLNFHRFEYIIERTSPFLSIRVNMTLTDVDFWSYEALTTKP